MNEYPIRASMWPMLFDCPHRFEGIVLKEMRSWIGMPAVMGSAIHAGTAAFDQGRIDGSGITADDAAEALVERLQKPGEDYRPQEDDPPYRKAESVCLTLLARYCTEWSPRFEFEAVEMKTELMKIDCGDGIVIKLTGTMDRSRIVHPHVLVPGLIGTGHAVWDFKTGKRAVEKGKATTSAHKAQLGTYELLYEHTTGNRITAPGGVIGLKTSGKPEIAEGEVRGAKLAMVGTPDQPGWIQAAANMFKAGIFPGNPQSNLCSPRYCPRWKTCIFR